MGSTGAKVVVLTTPFFQHVDRAGEEGRSWPEYDPWRVDRINALFRALPRCAHPGRYTLLDLNRYVSPGGKFADEIDGVPVRGDGVHFTPQGATFVAQVAGAPDQADRRGHRSRARREHGPVRHPQHLASPSDPGWGQVGAAAGRATANRPGVVGVISSVRKKCDSSSPDPMPVRDEPSAR